VAVKYRKVTAFVDIERLEVVEAALKKIDVPGVSVSFVKGYGDYKNFFTRDWLESSAKVEVFVEAGSAEAVVRAILGTAQEGLEPSGVVAVSPVEHLYEIQHGREIDSR